MKEYVIRCGSLLDGTGKAPIKGAWVVIKGENILRVETSPKDELVNLPYIDATEKTVLPGLIDAHKHYFNCGGFGESVPVGFTPRQAYLNIRDTLLGGVTSALDLSGPFFISTISKLPFMKPRMFYAGPILTCKGGYPAEYMNRSAYTLGVVQECDTEVEIRSAIEKLAQKGVAVIKTVVVSQTFRGKPQVNWTDQQLSTLVNVAHKNGLPVCAHITYPQDYAQAIRCGIDSIHHAAYAPMQEKDLNRMIENGIRFVPTLSLMDLMVQGCQERWVEKHAYQPNVNRTIYKSMVRFTNAFHKTPDDQCIPGSFIAIPKREMLQAPKQTIENLARFVQKGGIVAMGTDSALGFCLHTTPVREMELLQASGLSTCEVIKASTLTSASIFNKQDVLGSIEPGKLADILIVTGDLSNNLRCIQNIDTVILGGQVVVETRAYRTL